MVAMKPSLTDRSGRVLDYLRVSVTDACNYRCLYCGPGQTHGSLSLEQMLRICTIFHRLGVDTIRITGGEPLVHPSVVEFVASLSQMGISNLTMTTNASLLAPTANALRKAGLQGVNVSLDATEDILFSELSGGFSPHPVVKGIEKALEVGLSVKLNCVPLRNTYQEQVRQVMEFAYSHAIPVRFIELMPIGTHPSLHGVSISDVTSFLTNEYGVSNASLRSDSGKGPASYRNFAGVEVGLIGALTNCFCSSCNRLRLTSNGMLRSCLYHEDSLDLHTLLEQEKTDEEIQILIRRFVYKKPLRHDFEHQGIKDMTLASLGG